MTNKEILYAAAELILTGDAEFACCAIEKVVKNEFSIYKPLENALFELFDDRDDSWLIWHGRNYEENKQARVIGLLLLAEIIED